MLDQVLELRKKMLQVLKEIKTLCIEERYLESYQLLTTVPGIGMITAITLLTEIN
jgi:transposase